MEIKFKLKEKDSYEHAKIQYLKDIGELLANNDIMNIIIDGKDYCLKSLEIRTYDNGLYRDFKGNVYQEEPTYFIELKFDEYKI